MRQERGRNMFLITLNQILKMSLMMLLGFICSKCGVIDEKGNRTLSDLVLMVVHPCVFFDSFLIEHDASVLRSFFISFGIAAAAFAITILISSLVFRDRRRGSSRIETFSAIYSNCGFLCIPIVQALLGQKGVLYLTPYIFVFNILVWTHGLMLMSGKADKKLIIKGLTSPAILAMGTGLIFMILNVCVPPLIKDTISSIAVMNTPMGMLIAGISLGNASLRNALFNPRIYLTSAIRLAAVPLLLLLVFMHLPVSRDLLYINLIASACPAAATCTMFSLKYGQDHRYASEIFTISTILSIATIPSFVYLMEKIIPLA